MLDRLWNNSSLEFTAQTTNKVKSNGLDTNFDCVLTVALTYETVQDYDKSVGHRENFFEVSPKSKLTSGSDSQYWMNWQMGWILNFVLCTLNMLSNKICCTYLSPLFAIDNKYIAWVWLWYDCFKWWCRNIWNQQIKKNCSPLCGNKFEFEVVLMPRLMS